MRLTRVTLAVAAGALAPALLLSTPSFAAGATTAPAATASDTTPGDGSPYDDMDIHDLRIAVLRILADPDSGKRVTKEANALLDNGTEEDLRTWLETGYRLARFEDDQVAIFTILAKPSSGKGVYREATEALEAGTPEADPRVPGDRLPPGPGRGRQRRHRPHADRPGPHPRHARRDQRGPGRRHPGGPAPLPGGRPVRGRRLSNRPPRAPRARGGRAPLCEYGSPHPVCPRGRDRGEGAGGREAGLGEGGFDRCREGGDRRLLHEDDRRAAEAAAGHPGAQRAGGEGRVDDQVELGAGDPEVVAQRGVALGEDRARCRGRRPASSSAMTCSTRWFSVTTWRTRRRTSASSREARRAPRPGPRSATSRSASTPSERGALLAAGPPLAVLAVAVGVLDPGVDDQQPQALGGQVEGDLALGRSRVSR